MTVDAGLMSAYFALLRVMYDKGMLGSAELDAMARDLTDLSAAYEMKPEHRASIEEFSKAFMGLRPDRTFDRT